MEPAVAAKPVQSQYSSSQTMCIIENWWAVERFNDISPYLYW